MANTQEAVDALSAELRALPAPVLVGLGIGAPKGIAGALDAAAEKAVGKRLSAVVEEVGQHLKGCRGAPPGNRELSRSLRLCELAATQNNLCNALATPGAVAARASRARPIRRPGQGAPRRPSPPPHGPVWYGRSNTSAGMCHSRCSLQAWSRVSARLRARISEAREREPSSRPKSACA